MYDFFDILGVPESTKAVEVRRLTARYVRRCHPDFSLTPRQPSVARGAADPTVDFVCPHVFVDRILDSFFSNQL